MRLDKIWFFYNSYYTHLEYNWIVATKYQKKERKSNKKNINKLLILL